MCACVHWMSKKVSSPFHSRQCCILCHLFSLGETPPWGTWNWNYASRSGKKKKKIQINTNMHINPHAAPSKTSTKTLPQTHLVDHLDLPEGQAVQPVHLDHVALPMGLGQLRGEDKRAELPWCRATNYSTRCTHWPVQVVIIPGMWLFVSV